MTVIEKNNKWFTLTGTLHLFVAIGAVPPAMMFILQPDGALLGLSTEILTDSPFHSFFFPGLYLLIIIGLGSLFGCFYIYKKLPNSHIISIILGISLTTWIIVQVYWIGFVSWLQPLFLFIGISEIVVGFVLSKKRAND